jgi:hypothetical protein
MYDNEDPNDPGGINDLDYDPSACRQCWFSIADKCPNVCPDFDPDFKIPNQ